MQRYSEGKNREQVQVLSLEDMISEENPVRVFDAFVSTDYTCESNKCHS